ncbi:asparaginase [Oryzihumus leptocrescens]|uniref:asparaginase n=1 Tax=Oryzihumus leptocrescens TaxID=297536 RepID=UPI001FEA5194|nr:asparaginase [Oryzihumus leptocrescens]
MTSPAQPAVPLDAAPVVAHLTRSGFVESVHHGSVIALDVAGSAVVDLGPTDAPCFPRSSNKPVQGLAMLRAGLDLDGELLALACASHSGEAFHLEGARRILAGAGLTEADLQNTPDLPYDEVERKAWVAAGREATPLAQNCSGKHAAMLATCVLNGWDTATYRDPAHPLQQLMAQTLEDLTGEKVAATGIDGCGAPVMAVSLRGLARAFGTLASAPEGTLEAKVSRAIQAHPEWLGGTRRDVTALIRGVPGLIAKDGAESVYAVGLADGSAVALKIADGAQRARPVVMAAALRRLGVEAEVLATLDHAPVLGHGQPVGELAAVGI